MWCVKCSVWCVVWCVVLCYVVLSSVVLCSVEVYGVLWCVVCVFLVSVRAGGGLQSEDQPLRVVGKNMPELKLLRKTGPNSYQEEQNRTRAIGRGGGCRPYSIPPRKRYNYST